MTAVEILREAERRRIILRPEGESIRYRAPAGTMTPELRAAIVRQKPILLRLLAWAEWPLTTERMQ